MIYLAETTPGSRRLEELFHESWHCWMFHVPRPGNEEEMAQLMAMITASLMRDLASQGGEAALRALRPEPPVRQLRIVREWSA